MGLSSQHSVLQSCSHPHRLVGDSKLPLGLRDGCVCVSYERLETFLECTSCPQVKLLDKPVCLYNALKATNLDSI